MVGQRGGLRLLHMGKARHDGVQIFLHQRKEGYKKLPDRAVDLQNLFSHIKLHVQRHLVIPASSGVKLLARVPDPVDQVRLHKAVYILILVRHGKLSRRHILPNPGKAVHNCIFFLFRQDSLLCQHGRMGDASLNIFLQKALIKMDGSVELIRKTIRLLCETSAPELCHIYLRSAAPGPACFLLQSAGRPFLSVRLPAQLKMIVPQNRRSCNVRSAALSTKRNRIPLFSYDILYRRYAAEAQRFEMEE